MMNRMGKRISLAAFFLCLLAGFFLVSFAAPSLYRYVGASACAFCHSAPDKGDQYHIWLSSDHSKAFTSLTSEKGRSIAKEKGVTRPDRDPKCLSCHLTGFDAPFNLLDTLYRREDGVSCEACHGAGGGYASFSIMYDRKKAIGKGLIEDPKATCAACHDGKAHAMPPFDLDEALKKIAHPIPGRVTSR
jgi:hypothetical protein